MQAKGAKAQGRRKRQTGNGGGRVNATPQLVRPDNPIPTGGGGQTWTTAVVPPPRFSDLLTALGPERHLVSGHIEAVGSGRLCTHLRLLLGPSKIK